MSTSTQKSRRTTLVMLVVVGILVLLWVVLMRDEPVRAVSEASHSSHRLPVHISDDGMLNPVPPSPSVDQPVNPPAVAADAPVASRQKAIGDELRTFAPSTTPPVDAVGASGAGSTAFGVVDLERVISARQSGKNSQEARAMVLPSIRRAVAMRAAAHGFAFVVDTSAKSFRDTPLVVATNGAPDITDEVLQELSK